MSCLKQHLAGKRIDYIGSNAAVCNAGAYRQLLIKFIASDRRYVIFFGIEEIIIYEVHSRVDLNRLAGTQLLVYFAQGFHRGVRTVAGGKIIALVLFDRRLEAGVLTEHGIDSIIVSDVGSEGAGRGVKGKTQCTYEHGYGELAVLVNADVHDAVAVYLVFKPGSAIGYNGCGIGLFSCLVDVRLVIDAGRTDNLGYDDTLGAVYDEGTVFRHEREIAHVNIGLLYLTGQLVRQTHVHLQRSGIVHIPFLALLHRILGL